MGVKSKTIQIKYSGRCTVKYYEWIILRGPALLNPKGALNYYNDAQLVLCIF
jgi:hypothetical protein